MDTPTTTTKCRKCGKPIILADADRADPDIERAIQRLASVAAICDRCSPARRPRPDRSEPRPYRAPCPDP